MLNATSSSLRGTVGADPRARAPCRQPNRGTNSSSHPPERPPRFVYLARSASQSFRFVSFTREACRVGRVVEPPEVAATRCAREGVVLTGRSRSTSPRCFSSMSRGLAWLQAPRFGPQGVTRGCRAARKRAAVRKGVSLTWVPTLGNGHRPCAKRAPEGKSRPGGGRRLCDPRRLSLFERIASKVSPLARSR